MKRKSPLKWPELAVVTLALMLATAQAQPAYINYQGLLNDSGGQPLPTGSYTIEFNIYNDPVGTDPTNRVWGPFIFDGLNTDGHGAQVSIINGRFNVILGPNDTSARSIRDAFDGDNRYLELRVNDGQPILPRQQFLSTPYAFKAQGITGNLSISGDLGVQGKLAVQGDLTVTGGAAKSIVNGVEFFMVPRGSIVMWSGAPDAIPPGWALCDGANGTPDLRNRFVFGYDPGTPDNEMGQTGGTTNHTHSVDIPQFNTSTVSGNLGYVAIGRDDNISGSHFHTVNPPNTTSSATPHLPPYVRLGFIMKL